MIGFLNINKPSGITSHDVVAQLRRIIGIKQVGHGGTLDPAVTGVLPIAIGKATRLIRFLDTTKVYIAEILLGTTTTTDDLQGEVIEQNNVQISPEEVANSLNTFVGQLQQIPPMYSAINYKGKRLYALARSGVKIDNLPPREVTVHSIELLNLALPVVHIRVTCSGGTYIRSIARDLGGLLSCGGCLNSLHRQKAGPFDDALSFSLDMIEASVEQNELDKLLIAPLQALNLPEFELDHSQATSLIQGQTLLSEAWFSKLPSDALSSKYIATVLDKKLIAICQNQESCKLKPEVVIGVPESLY